MHWEPIWNFDIRLFAMLFLTYGMFLNGASIVVFKRVRIIKNINVSNLVYVLICVSSKERISSNISILYPLHEG
jgi:hypothetical protein